MFVSCGGGKSSSSDVGDKAESFMKDVKKAVEKENVDKAEKALDELEDWYGDLGKKDKKSARKAFVKFLEDNDGEDWLDDFEEMGLKWPDFVTAGAGDDDDEDVEDDEDVPQFSSPEEQAEQYLNDYLAALKKGDTEKAEKIEKEMDDWAETLSDDEKESIESLANEWFSDHIDELMAIAMEADKGEVDDDWDLEDDDDDFTLSPAVARKAEDILERAYKALKSGNYASALKIMNEAEEWSESLSDEESEALEKVAEKFAEKHPDFEELLENFSEEYDW